MKVSFSNAAMIFISMLSSPLYSVSALPMPPSTEVTRRDTTYMAIPGPQDGNVPRIRIRDNGVPTQSSWMRRDELAVYNTEKDDVANIRPVGAAVAQKIGSSVANVAKTAAASVSKAYNAAANAFGNAQELTKEVVKKAGSSLIDAAQSGISKLLGTSEEKKG